MNAWSESDQDLMHTLALRVQVLTGEQVARGWCDGSIEAAGEMLTALHQAGLIECYKALVHPLLHSLEPVFTWSPGEPGVSSQVAAKIAAQLQSRWTEPDYCEQFFVASKTAHYLYGTRTPLLPDNHQWTHDYHLSEIYVQLRLSTPDKANRWLGETALPKLGYQIRFMKDPDAFILDSNGNTECVVEYAGSYDAKHVLDLHDHCAGLAHQRERETFPNRLKLLYPDAKGIPYALY